MTDATSSCARFARGRDGRRAPVVQGLVEPRLHGGQYDRKSEHKGDELVRRELLVCRRVEQLVRDVEGDAHAQVGADGAEHAEGRAADAAASPACPRASWARRSSWTWRTRTSCPRPRCRRPGYDRVQALGPFFEYQRASAVYVRRLVLTLPLLLAESVPEIMQRPRQRDRVRQRLRHDARSVCAYLEGRGVPGEKAYVLRSVRTQLLPIADALKSMRGSDAIFLSRGLASCRVAHAQRAASASRSRASTPSTATRTRASARRPRSSRASGSWPRVPGARAAPVCATTAWSRRCGASRSSSTTGGAARARWRRTRGQRSTPSGARCAARPTPRAWRCTCGRTQSRHEQLPRQIAWARIAAFPAHTLVNAFTQPNILRAIETQALFTRWARAAACRRPWSRRCP